jgi:hypothetical protein
LLHEFDQVLSFRPGDERATIALQGQTAELRLSEDVLQRFARRPAAHERADLLQLRFGQQALKLDVELHATQSESMPDEGFGTQPGAFHAFAGEKVGGLLNDLEDRKHGCGRGSSHEASVVLTRRRGRCRPA